MNALLASLSIEQARATVRWARRSRGAVEAWETTEQPDVEWAVKTLVDAAREPQDDLPTPLLTPLLRCGLAIRGTRRDATENNSFAPVAGARAN